MSYTRRVLLCGRSLLISGLQANLEVVPGLELQTIDPRPDCIRERIAEWKPEVLILEISLLKSTSSLALLEDDFGLKIIGLDIEDNRLLVFSGSAMVEPTQEELLRVILEDQKTGKRGLETVKTFEGERMEGGNQIEPKQGKKTREKTHVTPIKKERTV